MILSHGLPRAEALRIMGLFTSLGMPDIEHLRALARMRSRDAWLHELCEAGDLTQFQMRVVKEFLEDITLDSDVKA